MNNENNNLSSNENDNEDFSKLFAESLNKTEKYQPGQKLSGKVISINQDYIFIDIASKSEAILSTDEYRDYKGQISINAGDQIDCFIVSQKGGEIEVTANIGKGFVNSSILVTAYENEIPVYGKVLSLTKGGYSISIGEIQGFCPLSQIDVKSSDNNNAHINRVYLFKLIEIKNGGNTFVASRRALLQEDKEKAEKSLKDTLKIGDVLNVKISKLAEFGVFVDIGGMDALVPRSEISHSKFTTIESFQAGAFHDAKVIDIDWSSRKITMSFKQTEGDSWKNIKKYTIGNSYKAKITNCIKSGAFAEIEPGIEGYIPINKIDWSKKITRVEDAVNIGDEVMVTILEINDADRKILLEVSTDNSSWNDFEKPSNEVFPLTIEFPTKGGVVARMENGMECFVPKRELVKLGDVDKLYKTGEVINVVIIETNSKEKKHICSEKKAVALAEQKEVSKYFNKQDSSNSSSLGAMFGDVFSNIQNKIK